MLDKIMITRQRSLTISALAVMSALHVIPALADDDGLQFDTQILKNRGLDSGLGQYFSSAARYTPGVHTVNVQVNGRDIGSLSPRFGKDGQLCVTESFLQNAGLNVPTNVARMARQEEDGVAPTECYDYRKDYPTAVITPHPGQEGLSLVVPPEAVSINTSSTNGPVSNYRTGGIAGLLNYQAFSSKTEFGDDSSTYNQAMLEEGFNMNDWLLRSRQSLTWDDGEYNSDALYTYAQRSIVPLEKQLQVGQINTQGSLLSGVSITGLQLTPDDALAQSEGSGVQVSGIARNAQARVDVRQQGRVVYSTLVPAGPFTLSDVPIISRTNDLEVTVTEPDGSASRFTVPASAINGNRLATPAGLSVAVGRYRDEGGETDNPMLATVSDGWRVAPWLNVGAGMMIAERYNALAGSVDTLPLRDLRVSGTVKLSDDQRGDNQGQSSTLSTSYALTQNFGVNASATLYSNGYRDLQDTLTDGFTQYSGQYSAGTYWSNPMLGTLSVGYTLSEGAGDSSDSRYVNASWGKSFGRVNLSVTWQTQVDNNDTCDWQDNRRRCTDDNDGDLLFVNLSIPLGNRQNVSFYSRTRDHDTTNGARTSGSLTENSNYSLSAERDSDEHEGSFSGSLNSNLHYTQLGLNASTQGSDDRNYSATLDGGIALHGDGVTFSPWAIKDTFGIISAGREVSGAKIDTPAGPVWTDYWGRAVIPSIPAYRNTRLEMDTASLPEAVDVDNGYAQLAAGYGSVSKVNFHALSVRRVMMHVRMVDGTVLKKGSSVVDLQGNYIATVVEDGLLFLGDATDSPALYLADEKGEHQCRITYTLPENQDITGAYENINGVCQ